MVQGTFALRLQLRRIVPRVLAAMIPRLLLLGQRRLLLLLLLLRLRLRLLLLLLLGSPMAMDSLQSAIWQLLLRRCRRRLRLLHSHDRPAVHSSGQS
jgi:hypothetical protein